MTANLPTGFDILTVRLSFFGQNQTKRTPKLIETERIKKPQNLIQELCAKKTNR